MSTLLEVRTEIAEQMTRTLSDSLVNAAINDAIQLWEAERFVFNVKRFLIQTVASQEYYDLSGSGLLNADESATETGEEILEIDSITATLSNQPYQLSERTQGWFDRNTALASQYSGQPDSYTIYGNQLRVFPVPDAAYDLDISALARLGPNPLSADTDANAWLTEGKRLIREQAKLLLYKSPLRDTKGIQIAQSNVDEAYNSLVSKMGKKAKTKVIRAWNL